MVARARLPTAAFRLTIVDGKVYIEHDNYRKWYQSRAVLNIWGILQLLRRYPGKLPDLDLIFDCEDWPAIVRKSQNQTAPPPFFTYCADDGTFDIVFPDWSFWGRPELHIKPWKSLSKELDEANKRIKWKDREPHAYWKGNRHVSSARKDLFKCNVSKNRDWNVRLYAQDWRKELQKGFKDSNLANECTHKYKIYVEGNAWSVSEKYILACDSVTLIVTPRYHDFFTRSLMPLHHYWPINENTKCKSIKFAVDWGERHKAKAQEIGKSSTKFIMEGLKMEYVYDYMFHLLNEYGKLLKFKPKVPDNAVEFCSETMACGAEGLRKNYMMETLEKRPATRNPCTLPPPYDSRSLIAMKKQRNDYMKQVGIWEKSYRAKQTRSRAG
ncbi:unnamed protein product [Rhodiola kirilowii]